MLKEECSALGQTFFDTYDYIQSSLRLIKDYSKLEFGKLVLDEQTAKMAQTYLTDASATIKNLKLDAIHKITQKLVGQIERREAPLTMEADFLKVMEDLRNAMLEKVVECQLGK